jgi:hypothetical protein
MFVVITKLKVSVPVGTGCLKMRRVKKWLIPAHRFTFRQKYIEFLKKFNIDYDERYIFKEI